MSEQNAEIIVLRKNVDALMDAVTQLQERNREDRQQIDWLGKKLVEVDGMHKQLFAVLHTINLQSLGAAVRQLQEKYRELVRAQETG